MAAVNSSIIQVLILSGGLVIWGDKGRRESCHILVLKYLFQVLFLNVRSCFSIEVQVDSVFGGCLKGSASLSQ